MTIQEIHAAQNEIRSADIMHESIQTHIQAFYTLWSAIQNGYELYNKYDIISKLETKRNVIREFPDGSKLIQNIVNIDDVVAIMEEQSI